LGVIWLFATAATVSARGLQESRQTARFRTYIDINSRFEISCATPFALINSFRISGYMIHLENYVSSEKEG
jgi:hypothetical protein